MCIKKYYALILCVIWHSHCICNVVIQGLPAGCALVTMKKTVVNNKLKNINILFKYNDQNFYVAQTASTDFLSQKKINATKTDATFFTNNDNGDSVDVAIKNKIYLNNNQLINIPPIQTNSLHDKPIVNLYNDQLYIVTQSSYPNIRFWETNNTGGFINIKEISKSFLLNYQNKHAVWGKKKLLNKNMVDIYIGCEFGAHSKSWILKKDEYNFLVEQHIFSIPLLNNNVMPACFIENNTIALYNDRYKKIDIFDFIKTTHNNKTEGKINLTKTIKLSEIVHEKNINLNTFLLYKTPFKIEYDVTNNSCILLYNDLIVKINLNTKTFSIVIKSENYWIIADCIIYAHKDVYVLWHNYETNEWQLLKYVIQ